MRSRLTGTAAFLAPWYRELFPLPPREVRAMTPTEVASVLGRDLTDAVAAVALADGTFRDLNADPIDGPLETPTAPKAKQRIRTVR